MFYISLFFHYRIYRRKYLGVMVAGTWLGAFSSLIPTWQGKWGQFGLDRKIGSCSILPDKDSEFSKYFPNKIQMDIDLALYVCYLNFVAVIVCYLKRKLPHNNDNMCCLIFQTLRQKNFCS